MSGKGAKRLGRPNTKILKRDRGDCVMSDYPPTQRFWEGGDCVSLGSALYYKKVAFVSLKIYTVAVYVEKESAVAKLNALQQQGYFSDKSIDHICAIINQPGFKRALHIRLLRDVSTGRFISEMSKDLGPRCQQRGVTPSMQKFMNYLQDKSIKTGCSLVCVWDESNTMAGGLYPPGFVDWPNAQPALSEQSLEWCQAMFAMYLDAQSVVPDGRQTWTANILRLAAV